MGWEGRQGCWDWVVWLWAGARVGGRVHEMKKRSASGRARRGGRLRPLRLFFFFFSSFPFPTHAARARHPTHPPLPMASSADHLKARGRETRPAPRGEGTPGAGGGGRRMGEGALAARATSLSPPTSPTLSSFLSLSPSILFQALNGFLAKADGKDKLTALIQYAAMWASAGAPGNARKVQASVAAARKVFRVFRPLESATPVLLDPRFVRGVPIHKQAIAKVRQMGEKKWRDENREEKEGDRGPPALAFPNPHPPAPLSSPPSSPPSLSPPPTHS